MDITTPSYQARLAQSLALVFLGTALALVVAVVGTGCVHRVDDGGGDGAFFVAEGDDLIGQLEDDDDAGFMHTRAIPVSAPFSRVGVRFDAIGQVAVQARASTDGGATFGPWVTTTLTFSEGRAHNAFADLDDGAAATHVQLRMQAPVESGLSFLAAEAFDLAAQESSSSSSSAAQALAADGIAQPKAQWGGRAAQCASGAQTPRRITIHNTETPNLDSLSMAARLRQIQNYHMDVRGWCAIGYHFLVGQDGVVYGGRAENVVGAHVSGANQDNVGIAFVGTFGDAAPSDAMMASATRVMRSLAGAYGIALSRSSVKGHRELGSTDCPGSALYDRLPALIDAALAPVDGGDDGDNGDNGDDSGGVYGGLVQGSASIPRHGLANPTLRATLGPASEPYGDVVTVDGRDFVQGKVSWFGGPNDTGVTSTETGSVSGERLRSLNAPVNASASTIASRPQDFYFVAMRWDYTPGRTFWKNARVLLVNPSNGKAVVVRPVDWGPNTSTHRIVDISPQAMKDLGTDTDHTLLVSFAAPGAALGVVDPGALHPPPPPPPAADRVIPAGATWQWQLTGTLDQSFDVDVYDIDLFDNDASTIAALQSDGRTVVCYFSAGTYEAWRPDAEALPSAARGNALDAPFDEERWLDTRSAGVREVMRARLDLAAQKGCDAVEPDNVDGYENDPGFSLTSATQLDFNRFLAQEAHARGLGVGLKNDVAQVPALVGDFDWALNEQCVEYDECDGYASTFIAQGKAVLNAEYNGSLSSICAVTAPLGLSTIKKSLELDAARQSCD